MACGGRLNLHITRFNVFMFLVWQFCLIVGGHLIFPIFINLTPEWSCDDDGEWSKNCTVLETCTSSGGNVTFRSPFYSGTLEFGLICERKHLPALISTLTFVGVLLGAIGFGQLSDFFGRKKIAIAVLSLAVLASGATAGSKSWEMLTVFRFFVGMAAGGNMNVLFAYTMEMIKPEQRLFVRGFFNWGWGRGCLTLICFLLPNYKHASLAMSVVAAIPLLAVIFIIPESTKFLESKGRVEELKKSLGWIAKFNGESDLIEQEMDELEQKCLESKTKRTESKRIYTIKDLFSSKIMIETTITLWVMWFAASLGGYANDLNSGNLAGDFYLNQFLFSILIGFGKTIIFLFDTFIPKFSRRVLHQSSQSLVLICYITIIILVLINSGNDQKSPSAMAMSMAVTVISLIGQVLIEYTWDACYVCAAEAFPTVVRTIGIGSSSVAARIGGIIAPQMTYLRYYWAPAPFATVVVVGIISLAVSCKFLPETKGKELNSDLPLVSHQKMDQPPEAKHFLPK